MSISNCISMLTGVTVIPVAEPFGLVKRASVNV